MKEVRPTTGMVLQALFNILGDLRRKSFLDLFSGTGKVAFEACRRGASPVVSVELIRSRSQDIWKKNRYDCHTHLSMDVRKGLSWVARRDMVFDVVFADPPYGEKWGRSLPELLASRSSIVARDGVIVIERSVDDKLAVPDPWILRDERKYGRSVLSFLSWSVNEEEVPS
ncbi:RsmD family RNA methyltransferase [Dethiosulfovibrio salsuginis]|uniref:16S rRNA (Guanine(966)-N(2))-methyltransferase RsmD n=1 Tax=Dethiosulfovibrio salsuginis TaxID=561720 RepID=A0A1X7IB49_9BACT|nr:RsmD family RNA methyltransferase [Dethiosulfovibrio salsuginis]SMG11307.1 16S rRNA (guanine(966)-N(2))-methyltransferase RsmD [Dethiosulfovibrio salsuginis]